jgi:exonuclease SbcC
MDGPRLFSIAVENFRSINRKVEVRLDAPVVLVQGPNGAGKTSLLTAIEFALTGGIPSLARADPKYKKQILHHGADLGRVLLEVRDVNDVSTDPIRVELNQDGVTSTGKLSSKDASFFSERCVLAQSLLTQLLTIYQEADSGIDSPLSRFVHELLGLDRLDALELGLDAVRDLRNARKLTPIYQDVERERGRIRDEIETIRAQLVDVAATIAQGESALSSASAVLQIRPPGTAEERANLEKSLMSNDDELALVTLTEKERYLTVLRRELGRLVQTTERAELEASYRSVQDQLSVWHGQYQSRLDAALGSARRLFTNVDLPDVSDPARAVVAAMTLVSAEIERLDVLAARDDADAKRSVQVEDALGRARSRIATLDVEIGEVAAGTGALSAALSELLPHIHTDDCPVCGRDYQEVSTEPLSVRVASRAAELSDQAERLSALSRERATLEGERATLEREHEMLVARTLGPKASVDLRERLAKLREACSSLKDLEGPTTVGSNLVAAELSARRSLARLHTRGSEEELRLSIVEQAVELGLPTPDPTEAIGAVLDRLDERVQEERTRVGSRLEARNSAQKELRDLTVQYERLRQLREKMDNSHQAETRVAAALKAAERIRADSRRILSVVATTRTAIVSRVFNDRLNRLWRDLFVRLAPSENFVPAFHIPTNPRSQLAPTLETRHRSGATGGTPGAMLSTGNLNTAALTLFLALHLSVRPQLPWLILDDPVQSMDEVHIAHFAALLRTLAKEHRRQVVISVHDRALYDYLSLELSPAFPGDELITIEIGMSAERRTRFLTSRRTYEPDTALKPVAA